MKTYEAIFDENQNTGVYGISLVASPAMEGVFIALSKQEVVKFKEVDNEERKVVGLVLEPNKLIYRNDGKEEYNIVFNENTIKNLSYNFFKQNFQKNSTIEHNENNRIENVTFVESWIVEDVKKDKQQLYGFDYPVGSWLAVLKIDNDDVWNNYVKTGQVKGFSIDGLLSLKEVNLKSEINMLEEVQKQTSILTELANAIKTAFSKEVVIKFGEIKTADGSVTIEFDGEELMAGANAWIMAEDETKIPVPVGEHPLEDGRVLIVTQEGIVAEVKESTPVEAAPAELTPSPMSAEVNNDAQIAKEIETAIKSILIKYSTLEEKVDAVIKENEALKVTLSETPAKSRLLAVPTQVEFKTAKERLLNKITNK
jgi:hypothetical protein